MEGWADCLCLPSSLGCANICSRRREGATSSCYGWIAIGREKTFALRCSRRPLPPGEPARRAGFFAAADVDVLQVIDNTVAWMNKPHGQQVFRAKFSAISAQEIKAAMVCPAMSSPTGVPVLPSVAWFACLWLISHAPGKPGQAWGAEQE